MLRRWQGCLVVDDGYQHWACALKLLWRLSSCNWSRGIVPSIDGFFQKIFYFSFKKFYFLLPPSAPPPPLLRELMKQDEKNGVWVVRSFSFFSPRQWCIELQKRFWMFAVLFSNVFPITWKNVTSRTLCCIIWNVGIFNLRLPPLKTIFGGHLS